MMSDVLQFFEKLMDESAITANGSFDSVTDGFQLFEAFKKQTRNYKTIQGFVTSSGFTEEFNDTGGTVVFSTDGSYRYYDLTVSGAVFTVNKTAVLCSNRFTTQSSSNLIVVGGSRTSDTVVRVTCMTFIDMDGSTSTASGTNVSGGQYPEPIFVEIRIYD